MRPRACLLGRRSGIRQCARAGTAACERERQFCCHQVSFTRAYVRCVRMCGAHCLQRRQTRQSLRRAVCWARQRARLTRTASRHCVVPTPGNCLTVPSQFASVIMFAVPGREPHQCSCAQVSVGHVCRAALGWNRCAPCVTVARAPPRATSLVAPGCVHSYHMFRVVTALELTSARAVPPNLCVAGTHGRSEGAC